MRFLEVIRNTAHRAGFALDEVLMDRMPFPSCEHDSITECDDCYLTRRAETW
jgi:hypothetical protein